MKQCENILVSNYTQWMLCVCNILFIEHWITSNSQEALKMLKLTDHLNNPWLQLLHRRLLFGLHCGAHHLPLHHAVLVQSSLVLVEDALLVALAEILGTKCKSHAVLLSCLENGTDYRQSRGAQQPRMIGELFVQNVKWPYKSKLTDCGKSPVPLFSHSKMDYYIILNLVTKYFLSCNHGTCMTERRRRVIHWNVTLDTLWVICALKTNWTEKLLWFSRVDTVCLYRFWYRLQ